MNQEIELKLRINEQQLPQLINKLDTIAKRETGLNLINQYFDTPQQSLSQAGAALRIRQQSELERQEPAKIIQTLKTRGQSDAGLHTRMEWDWSLSNLALDIEKIRTSDAQEYLSDEIALADIAELFTTNFDRRIWMFNDEENRIEVVVDQGHVSIVGEGGRSKSVPLLEVELELKKGQAQSLFNLAEQLVNEVPMVMSDISKAERGYALLAQQKQSTINDWAARAPKLDMAARLADSFKPLFSYELSKLQRGLELGIWQQDPHAVIRIEQSIWSLNNHISVFADLIATANSAARDALNEIMDQLVLAMTPVVNAAKLVVHGEQLPATQYHLLSLEFEQQMIQQQASKIWGQKSVELGRWLFEFKYNG